MTQRLSLADYYMEISHNLMEDLWDRTNEYPNIEREKTKNLLQPLDQE